MWLANQRGSRYSRTHTKFTTSSFQYWNYSLDTMASNDIPALLKLVANVTEKESAIIYIGHSRGATLIFMYASEYPAETQKLLKCVVALCPAVYLNAVWYIKLLSFWAPSIGVSCL